MEYQVPRHEICKYSSEHARVVSSSLTLHCHVLEQSKGNSSLAIKPQHGISGVPINFVRGGGGVIKLR
jgi:hypothetical protein